MIVITINDDSRRPHKIKIPNSLFLPDLMVCVFLPQHWAQEERDNHPLPNGTRMENNATNCMLIWVQSQFQKTIPFDSSMNIPIFFTLPSTFSYRAFVSKFQALEVPFFRREHVLQYPGWHMLDGDPPPKEEFLAEENVNFKRRTSVGAMSADDDTVPASNLPLPQEEAAHPGTLQQAALTFYPSPPLKEAKEYSIEAPDDQAVLMRWHYCLGHLAFKKLQQLACNSEIPKRLVNVRAPICAGCLFGAMTKVPWRGKKRKSEHTVFVVTKPGECVSVDHLISMEPGFFGKAKGTLTKTR
jgi:hypothetical protein